MKDMESKDNDSDKAESVTDEEGVEATCVLLIGNMYFLLFYY